MAHQNVAELQDVIESAKRRVDIGQVYVHYKHHDQYIVRDIVILESNTKPAVLYSPAIHPHIAWVRPLDDFLAEVEPGCYRFTKHN